MKQDKALRIDAIKQDNLSPTEAAAQQIVRVMRAEEADSVWGAEHEDVEHPFPGMEFLTSRSVIMKTKVFRLLHKVRPRRYFILFPSPSPAISSDHRVVSVGRCPRGPCSTPIWTLPSTSTFC